VEYIKDREILYVSLGEEFDEGSVFAEYKIVKELGAGGFGKVFEARHRISKE
jgi:serine/threonine protein kinase